MPRTGSPLAGSAIAWGAITLIGAALLWPLAAILSEGFIKDGVLTGRIIAEAAGAEDVARSLENSLVIIAVASTLATAVGTILAVVATKLNLRWSRAFRAIPLVPLTVAPLVGAIGWVFLLAPKTGWLNLAIRGIIGGTEGPFNIFGLWGAIWVTTLYVIPYVFTTMSAALDRTGSDTLEAFLLNGTGRIMAAVRVLTGVVRPALVAGFILAALESAMQFSIPLILDVHVLTTGIYRYIHNAFPTRTDLAAALATAILLFGLLLTAIELMILRGRRFTSVAGRGLTAARWSFGRAGDRILAGLAVGYVMVSAILPMAAILLVSLLPFWKPNFSITDFTIRHYSQVFRNRGFLDGLTNSVQISAICVMTILVGATLISLYRSANRRLPGRALYVVGNLPLGVPGLVLGLGALIAYTSGPLPLYGTTIGLIFAYIVHFLPLGLRNIDPVVRQVGDELQEAARVSGAGWARSIFDVSLPMILPGITAAAAVTFILMLREFPMSALLATPANKVVSVYLVDSFENGVFSQVASMAMLLSIFSMVGVILFQAINRRVRFGARRASKRPVPTPPA